MTPFPDKIIEHWFKVVRPSWPELMGRMGEVPEVEGDPVRLQEILVNLVTNAIQHSPEGALIMLGGEREQRDSGEWVVVSVTAETPLLGIGGA